MFPRGSGILLHISSLPSPYGIGDLGPQAYAFADTLQNAVQSYWQVLPLNPTDEGSYNSPYFSCSSTAGNPLLISIDRLVESGLLDRGDIPPCSFPAEVVDYSAVTSYKHRMLEIAYDRFCTGNEKAGFHWFCKAARHWLDDFALFMAAKKRFGNQPWNRWPDPIKRHQDDALDKFSRESHREIEREKWYQYVFSEQWTALKVYCNERSIRIIGDTPIYVSYNSADVWAHPGIFKLDDEFNPVAVSGVPPDCFSDDGQLWNNPVYNWDNLEAEGFTWWTERLQSMFTRFDIVRIDHFRGLVKYWEVPAGEKTAINGSWQPVPTYRLFDTLIRNIPGFPVIAEDLGIITDDVQEAMDHYGFPGMKVLLFAFGDDDPDHPYLPHRYTENCFVYTGTHDNNTIRGWFEHEAGEKERERFFRYTGMTGRSIDSVIRNMIRLAQSSPAAGAIIPAQDLLMLGGDCRMNRPAIAEGNWKWRMTPGQMGQLPVTELSEMALLYKRAPGRNNVNF